MRTRITLTLSTAHREFITIKLFEGATLIDQQKTMSSYAHSQHILPGIQEVLRRNALTLKNIGEIQVHTGPGSYTGLRIGVAIAQALGYARDIPVNGHSPLEQAVEVYYE